MKLFLVLCLLVACLFVAAEAIAQGGGTYDCSAHGDHGVDDQWSCVAAQWVESYGGAGFAIGSSSTGDHGVFLGLTMNCQQGTGSTMVYAYSDSGGSEVRIDVYGPGGSPLMAWASRRMSSSGVESGSSGINVNALLNLGCDYPEEH